MQGTIKKYYSTALPTPKPIILWAVSIEKVQPLPTMPNLSKNKNISQKLTSIDKSKDE